MRLITSYFFATVVGEMYDKMNPPMDEKLQGYPD